MSRSPGQPHWPQAPDLLAWRKSSYSAYNGNCVEVADLDAGRIGVRDSKDPAGPVLEFSTAEWCEFVERYMAERCAESQQ